ncbi:MAG: histidine kinase [Treponema sp.]|nr:histidine kinase [Treponema sp.]
MKIPRVTLRRQLFLLFSAVTLLPLVLCAVLLYRRSITIIEENIGATFTARLDYFSSRFNTVAGRFYQDLLNLAVDRTIRQIMFYPMDITGEGYSDKYEYLSRNTRNVIFTDNMIHSIQVYSMRGNWLFVINSSISNLYTGYLGDLEWVKNAVSRSGERMVLSASVSAGARTDGEEVISLFIPIRDFSSHTLSGYISINLDIEALKNQLYTAFRREQPRNIVMIDSRGKMISEHRSPVTAQFLEEMDRLIGKNGASGYYTTTMNSEVLLVTYTYLPVYKWRTLILIPYDQVNNQIGIISNFVIIIIALFALLYICIAYILSRKLLNPLKILFKAMGEVKEGKIGLTIPGRRGDEIGLLYDGFNEMSKNLKAMMERSYQDELAKRDIQLKMMGYQINAHFLYNTLDTIHWIASINKVPKITSLVASLVSYFRITLSEGKDIITIQKVVELAENYLNIYTIKSDYHVDFKVDIDPSLYQYRTLKYIFQPLLENALSHGIEKKAADGELVLGCRLRGEDLFFTVADTGVGIPEEKLKDIQNTLMNSEFKGTGNFALRNINLQIKIFFGGQYGLEIDSVYGKGATVTIRVPAITGNEDA